MPLASADSVLRVNARSAEVNSRPAEEIVTQPAPRHLSRYFYPGKYNQTHDSRGIRTKAASQLSLCLPFRVQKCRTPAEAPYEIHRDHRRWPCRLDRAAMLGRAGIPTVLIDPHQVYPFDFRVEKISGDEQFDRFFVRPQSPIRCSARPPMTAKTGSRDSAICSTRSRAANTASCTTR
jgi:hypothetical protein